MTEVKEGILIELGSKMAPFLQGMNMAKLSVGGFVAFSAYQLKQFDTAARNTERVWERSMAEISTIANATRADISGMREELATMSKEFGQKFENVARARYDVISSGFSKIADSQTIMTASAKGAVGGLTDIATAAKITTAVLNAYAMDAGKATMVNDMLFATVRDGVTTYEELASQLGDVTSTAAAMKIPLSELLAFVATTTLSGVSVPESITAINQFLLAFVKQTEEAKKVSAEYGITLRDGLGPALEKIADLSKQDLEAVTELLPSVRAIKGALAGAAEDGQRFADIQDRIVSSAGQSEAAFVTMSNTFDMTAKKLAAAKEELQATWGELRAPENQAWAELQLSVISKMLVAVKEFKKLREEASKDLPPDMGGAMGAHGAYPGRSARAGRVMSLPGGVPFDFPQLYSPGRTGALPGLGGAMTDDLQNMLYAFNERQIAAQRAATADAQAAASAASMADYYQVAAEAAWSLAQAVASVMDYSAATLGPGEAVSTRRLDAFGRPTDENRQGEVSFSTRAEYDSFASAMDFGGSLGGYYKQQSSEETMMKWDEAQRRLAVYESMAGSVIGNTVNLIEDGIYGGLVEAFGGGESAVARFAASTLSQLASIIFQATVMRSILSSIGLGGFFGLFESGGYVPGYAWGGYTGGSAGARAARGVVHGGEYVLNAAATKRAGVHNLDRLNASGGDTYNFGGITVNGTPTESSRRTAAAIVDAIPGAMRSANRTGRIKEAVRTNRRK